MSSGVWRGRRPRSGSLTASTDVNGSTRAGLKTIMPRVSRISKPSKVSEETKRTTEAAPSTSMAVTTPRAYYLIIATRDHVRSAISSSIVQANHGVRPPLMRMHPGDGVVFYSPRYEIKGKDACQRFTAIAKVDKGDVYQEQVTEKFKPWRRRASFEGKAREVDVKDVLRKLDCLGRGEGSWGVRLRRGFMKISEADWKVLWKAMMGQEVDA